MTEGLVFPLHASITQMGEECLFYMEEVVGSMPTRSTNRFVVQRTEQEVSNLPMGVRFSPDLLN